MFVQHLKRHFTFGVVLSTASVNNLELYEHAEQRSVDLGRVGQEGNVKILHIQYTVSYG